MQAYCMKCRAKKEMKDAKSITYEEREASNSGRMSHMWDQDVQDTK